MNIEQYFYPDFNNNKLGYADRETQLIVMDNWFRMFFEKPDGLPYSDERGYCWMWGGPCFAQQELEKKFSSYVPHDVIKELVDKLNNECLEWSPVIQSETYTDYYHYDFSRAIFDIEHLLETKIENSVSNCFYRLLFVNVITALETYLFYAFIKTVLSKPDLIRRVAESPELKKEKDSPSDVSMDKMVSRVETYLSDKVVWHNLKRVMPMYNEVLKLNFPPGIDPIFQAIEKRHDIVHRNGKTKKDVEINVTAKDVQDLIVEVKNLVHSLSESIRKF
ncbi:MAG: hypothetical protein HGB11_06105 [Chlorobiales bacterium]|jgi:hypothetical protein|nr:hypothetical protein [Chlorobiales bacterium]